MKAILCILVIFIASFGSVAMAMDEDQVMLRYSELKLDYSTVHSPIDLHNQIMQVLGEIDSFLKESNGEKSMVQIYFYDFSEAFWKEMRKVVKERGQLQMNCYRYIKDENEGISEAFLFQRRWCLFALSFLWNFIERKGFLFV